MRSLVHGGVWAPSGGQAQSSARWGQLGQHGSLTGTIVFADSMLALANTDWSAQMYTYGWIYSTT